MGTGAMFVSKKESYDTSKLYLWGEEVPIDDDALINTRNMYFGEDNKQPPILTSTGIRHNGKLKDYDIPVTPRHILMTDEVIPGTDIPFSNEKQFHLINKTIITKPFYQPLNKQFH